nr:actin cytoskeleton-regulatory complex protein PAN1-like [Aegilops tauschii subsp. strangulata]
MPTFDGRGLVLPAPPAAPAASAPVDLSYDDSRQDEEEGDDEEHNSGATPEGMGETSPLRKADILRTQPDNDETDDLRRGEPPVIPMKGRSALVSRGAAPALMPPGAAFGLYAAPSSAPGVRAPAPHVGRLSGFKLSKRRVDYAAVDQPTPAAKKRKEEAVVLFGTNPPAPAASPSVEKGGAGAHVSPPRSSSRGLGKNPREESTPVAPLAPEAPASGSAAEVSKAQEPPASQAVGADSHLVTGRLELVSGWLHSDVSVRAKLSQAAATSKKEKWASAQAAVAREAALKDAEAAQDHSRGLEAELKALCDRRAEEARGREADEEKMKVREDAIKDRDADLGELARTQAAERRRLVELERKVEAEKAKLDAKVKVLAEDRTTFALLEERHGAPTPSPALTITASDAPLDHVVVGAPPPRRTASPASRHPCPQPRAPLPRALRPAGEALGLCLPSSSPCPEHRGAVLVLPTLPHRTRDAPARPSGSDRAAWAMPSSSNRNPVRPHAAPLRRSAAAYTPPHLPLAPAATCARVRPPPCSRTPFAAHACARAPAAYLPLAPVAVAASPPCATAAAARPPFRFPHAARRPGSPPLAVAHAGQMPPRPGGLASPPRSGSAPHGCARNRTAGARAR